MAIGRKTFTGLAAAALMGLATSASAYTLADLGLDNGTNFAIKFQNYEVLIPDATAGSGLFNTDGLYLGDNFGIFDVSSIRDQDTNSNVWSEGAGGNTITRLTGIFWGFDVYNVTNGGANAVASGGHIALFANASFTNAIREQGPGNMLGQGTSVIDGINMPTYNGITDTGTLLVFANYASGCDPTDAAATLCSPFFGGGSFGAATGFADVDATVGDLGANFATGSILTPTPGVFRDLKLDVNFAPNFLKGGAGSNWPIWSDDPVRGQSKTVPEPATVGLLGLGLLGAVGLARRNKKAA